LKTKKKKLSEALVTDLFAIANRERDRDDYFIHPSRYGSDGRQPLIYMLERKTKEKDHAISSIKLIYTVGQTC
jgi:hypothetical protein